MIICLSGYARTGKDTVASTLVKEYGFRKIAFAGKLREAVYALNPLVRTDRGYIGPNVYLQDVIVEYGWDGVKETPFGTEVRRLLQRAGTEMGRQVLDENVWVNAALKDVLPDDNIVVTDGRFFNEFDAVRNRGGYVWRIERTGVGPLNDHPSETEAADYPNFSIVLHNNGTLAELEKLVCREYESKRFTEWGQ